jgi:hypothetical protein
MPVLTVMTSSPSPQVSGSALDSPIRSGHHEGIELAVEILAEHGELVSAEAGQGVAGAEDGLQPLGQGLQDLVADGVPKAVVDDLEPIDVDEEQTDRSRAATEPCQAWLMRSMRSVRLGGR